MASNSTSDSHGMQFGCTSTCKSTVAAPIVRGLVNNSTEFAIVRVYTNYRVRVHTAIIWTLAYGIVTVTTILLLLYYYYHIMDYFTLKLPLLLSSTKIKPQFDKHLLGGFFN